MGLGATAVLLGAVPPESALAIPALSGTWECTASGEGSNGDRVGHFDLNLKQAGDAVTGSYYQGTATLSGELKGDTLRGRWEESQTSTGVFTFVFESDGESFTGTWGLKEGDTAGTWSGKRK